MFVCYGLFLFRPHLVRPHYFHTFFDRCEGSFLFRLLGKYYCIMNFVIYMYFNLLLINNNNNVHNYFQQPLTAWHKQKDRNTSRDHTTCTLVHTLLNHCQLGCIACDVSRVVVRIPAVEYSRVPTLFRFLK